ncbi:MAG: N-acetylmuramoyl-L-alanine amidase [Lysinibacillus sp.]
MITISPGHWKPGTGAVGLIDEVTEARRVVDGVVSRLKGMGIVVHPIQDDSSKSQSENLRYLVQAHNRTERQLDVSIHFNAIAGKHTRAIGTEVLYQDAKMQPLASQLSKAIGKAAGFPDRGAKKRNDLAFLNGTKRPAILIEVCFVNSTVDVALYKQHMEAICETIAKQLAHHVRPSNNPFSSPALYERTQMLHQDKQYVRTLLDKGISQGTISILWKEKFESGELSFLDFCGLCVLVLEKRA